MKRECVNCGCLRVPSKRILNDDRLQHGLWCNSGCGGWDNVRSSQFGASQKFEKYSTDISEELRRNHFNDRIEPEFAKHRRERAEWSARWWDIYVEFIRPDNPVWQEQRRLVMERDHGICQACLVNNATQVHHVRYPRNAEYLDRIPLFYLMATCKPCHDCFHEMKDAGILE